MAKKKEKAAAKEETVQAIEGELEDEEVADDNSPGKVINQSQNAKRASSQKRHMVISIFLLCKSLILMSMGARSIRAI